MAGRLHNKKVGNAWEYDFFARALSLGLDVFIPAGDHLPVDCHVVNKDGKIYRVQCKGTGVNNKTKGECRDRYKIVAATGNHVKTPIDCDKVDVMACYIEPCKVWYLVPCPALGGMKGMWFYPNYEDSKSKYASYKENWSIFNS